MVQSWNLLRTQNKVTSLGAPQNKPKEASRLVSPICPLLPREIHTATSSSMETCAQPLEASARQVCLSIHGLSASVGTQEQEKACWKETSCAASPRELEKILRT